MRTKHMTLLQQQQDGRDIWQQEEDEEGIECLQDELDGMER